MFFGPLRAVTASGTRAEHVRQALDLNRMEAGEIRPPKTLSSPASSPKKRSVPLLSSHRLSARAASGGVGFLFSFALSASLCVFLCSCLLDRDASEDFFSRGAEAREFFSREAARERGSLSRGSTQEKKSVAWQHAREGAFSFSKSEPPFCLFPFSFVVDDARTTTRVRSYFPPSARRVCILFRERD